MPKAIQHRQGETAGWFRCCFGSPARTWGKALEMAGRGQHDHGYLHQCRVLLRAIVFLCDSRYLWCNHGNRMLMRSWDLCNILYFTNLKVKKIYIIYRFAVKTSILSAAFLIKIAVLIVACEPSACQHLFCSLAKAVDTVRVFLPVVHPHASTICQPSIKNNDLHSITT